MRLKILLPSRVFGVFDDVSGVVAETPAGSFGILPHRLDCVAALVPGILTYTCGSASLYLAIDAGVLAKTGADVLISVRRAMQGSDLGALHDAVKREFLSVSVQEAQVRTAMAKMESGFMAKFADFQNAR